MKRIVAALFIMALLCSCHKETSDTRPTLAVSMEPQRALLEEIAGPRYRVVTVLERGINPETFDPSPRVIADASAAERYFTLGVFPFEISVEEAISTAKTVSLNRGIERIYGTHRHEGELDTHYDDENAADPHIWSSVRNARVFARRMANEMITIDPDSAEAYMTRYLRLDQRLQALDSTFTAELPAGTAFAVWHPSLSYFARDYGLRQIAIGHEGKDMSARQLRDAIETARRNGTSVFVIETGRDTGRIASVNSSIGADTVNVNLISYDWEEQLRHVVDALAGAQ